MENKHTSRRHENTFIGQAGVYAVASQLCLRNHVPFFPSIDMGVDLVLENGLRIQVKVSRLTNPDTGRRARNLVYTFNLRRAIYDKQRKRISKSVGRSYADVADFFVLWGIEENRFWIVPTSCKNKVLWFVSKGAVNRSSNAAYYDKFNSQRCAEMEDRWDLLDVNAAVDQIAATFPKAGEYPVEIDVKEKI